MPLDVSLAFLYKLFHFDPAMRTILDDLRSSSLVPATFHPVDDDEIPPTTPRSHFPAREPLRARFLPSFLPSFLLSFFLFFSFFSFFSLYSVIYLLPLDPRSRPSSGPLTPERNRFFFQRPASDLCQRFGHHAASRNSDGSR